MKKLVLILLPLFSKPLYAVPEIPDPTVNDIAMTTVVNGKVVILYNPAHCKKLGPLVCSTIRAHEYGHVRLGHIEKQTNPVQAEFEADCWFARNASLQQVEAAYSYFREQGEIGDRLHGSGIQRAHRIYQCASTRSAW